MLTAEEVGAWPGKTIDGANHPALWHLLDVGAVAKCLIANRSLTRDALLDQAFAFFVALHDLGKFSASFRDMLLGRPYWGFRHWQHTYRLLLEHDHVVARCCWGNTRRPEDPLCRSSWTSWRPA